MLIMIILLCLNFILAISITAIQFNYNSNLEARINFTEFNNFFEFCTVVCILTEDNILSSLGDFPLAISSYHVNPSFKKMCQCLVVIDIDCLNIDRRILSEFPLIPKLFVSRYDCVMNKFSSINCDEMTTGKYSLSVCNYRNNLIRPNLGGLQLKIATMVYIPFFIRQQESTLNYYDGIEVELIKEMAKQLNFTYEFLVYKTWGNILSNGSWEGDIAGIMQEGQADIAVANLWEISSMYSLMNFGPSIAKIKAVFLVWRPEVMDFRWQTMLKTFKPIVWYCTLTSSILITLMHWIGIKLIHPSRSENCTGSVLTVLGFFTSTTSYSRVDEGNVRIILTTWSIFTLLLTTSLSSGIVSSLALPTFTPRIDTLQQLVEGKFYWTAQYYIGANNNSEAKAALFDMKNLWVRCFERTYKYLDEDEVKKRTGVDKKMTFPGQTYNDFVILDTEGLFGHKGLYKYRVAEEHTTENHVSFGVKKTSDLLEPLTRVTLRFLENGLLKHWNDEVLRRWQDYDTSHLLIEEDFPTFGEPQPLQLSKLQPVFYFLLFGLFVSTFTFLVEMWW